MKRIHLYFDYGSWPVVLENDNDISDYDFMETVSDQHLKKQVMDLETLYESCFQNDLSEFRWLGCTDGKKATMMDMISDIEKTLRKEYPGIEIVNDLPAQLNLSADPPRP